MEEFYYWIKLRLVGMNQSVEPLIIYFQNNTIVSTSFGEHRISYYDPPDMPDSEQRLDKLCNMDNAQIQRDVHEGSLIPMHKERVRELITSGPSRFFSNNEHRGILGKPIELNPMEPKPHKLELAKYMDIQDTQRQIWPPRLISKIIQNSLLQSDEMHPTPSGLTDNLYRLKNKNELAYKHLQELFTDIFHDTKVRVEQKDPHNENMQTTWITEGKRTFKLTNSASGYLEAIHILYTVLNHTQCAIFSDEPEVHFHPTKIRQISQMLSNLTKESDNQVTIITHRPKFLNHGLLDSNSQSMLTMVTKVDSESSVASPQSQSIDLKPHMFVPDVFFANAVFLVEGASDEFTIRAISDAFDGIFDRYEIAIVNCGGVGGIETYIDLLKLYSIKYHGWLTMNMMAMVL